VQEETCPGEGHGGARWRRRKPQRGEELTTGHEELDGRGGGGHEDVGVSRATVGISLEKKDEATWWVGADNKGRRRRLGFELGFIMMWV